MPQTTKTKPLSILCVDDVPENQLLLRTILEKAGYTVSCASNGYEAFETLKDFRPHLILTDIQMPEMDGYTFCRLLQDYPQFAVIPVIFLSHHTGEKDRLKAFQAGAADFLERPYQEKDVLALVKKHLRTHHTWKTQVFGSAQAAPEKSGLPAPAPKPLPGSYAGFLTYLQERLPLPSQTLETLSQTPQANLSETLHNLGLDEQGQLQEMAAYLQLERVESIAPEQLKLGLFPISFMQANGFIPLQDHQEAPLVFVLSNPFDLELQDLLKRQKHSIFKLATAQTLQRILAGDFSPQGSELSGQSREQLADISDLEKEMVEHYPFHQIPSSETPPEEAPEDSPFIARLVNRIIEGAYYLNASDIHIEPRENEILVRLRIDGSLREVHHLKPPTILQPLISRLKIMSDLDIADRRLPQDGRIVFKQYSAHKLDIDLRVSTIPSQFGESVVMRIIDKNRSQFELKAFGFSEANLTRYQQSLKQPHGLILNVGPTGSGKTTTLYAALNQLNQPERKILTIEDPIEYSIPGIVQVETQPEVGLSFQRALRAFLRQDPDVILLGEIRDLETAKIAIEAALTGHLVLSTMHTNDAPSTITRFMEMGIQPFMVSSSLVMICAQRLIRRLCPDCKAPYPAEAHHKQQLGLSIKADLSLYRAQGCEHCEQSGYRGRIGVHEILVPNDTLRETLSQGQMSTEALRALALKQNLMTPLYRDALDKVQQGLTSLEEVQTKIHHD